MKRFLSFLALTLLWPIWRAPAWAQLTTLGVGGIAAVIVGTLTTPTVIPQGGSYFNEQSANGQINDGLKLNGGTVGALELPTTIANSHWIYVEAQVDNIMSYFTGTEYLASNGVGNGLLISTNAAGQPAWFTGRNPSGVSGAEWWNAYGIDSAVGGAPSVSGNTGYNNGEFTWTATGGNCEVEPSGVWMGQGKPFQVTNPGFNCGSPPSLSLVNIPGDGAQQATGAGTATTCTPNSPIAGDVTITAHVAVAHGVAPGQTFAFGSFPSPFSSASYTAMVGTGGTTLVGAAALNGGSCTGFTGEGTALSGVGGTVSFQGIPFSAALPFRNGGTGVTARNGQHVCGIIGEYGADSNFPGAQFVHFVDEKGNALPGAPALVPNLNQGTANWQGYTTLGAQPGLHVTSMNSTAISSATYVPASGGVPAKMSFVVSTSPGFMPGSEFTVSGLTSTGASVNLTYVADGATTQASTTIVGIPLSGPLGTPSALASPGTIGGSGSFVSVILPGMFVLGTTVSNSVVILPFPASQSGQGGVGDYALGANQAASTFLGAQATVGSSTLNVTGTPNPPLVVGTAISGTGIASGTVITSVPGTSSGTFGISIPTTAAVSGTQTNIGTIGSIGAPVNMFGYAAHYFSAIPNPANGGGTVSMRSQAAEGDFWALIGSTSATLLGSGQQGWGGSMANLAMLWGVFPQTATGAPDTTQLASLCKKTTDIQNFATTNGSTVHSLYRMNDTGIWADSGAASFEGYITGASGATATLNVSSTQYGTLTGSGTVVIAGPGIPGCPLACPTAPLGAGPTYTLTWGSSIAANVGSSGSPVAMSAGAFKPATPLPANNFNGYIDGDGTAGHPPTLHVTSIPTGASTTFSGTASFAATLGNGITSARIDSGAAAATGVAGNVLTVISTPNTGYATIGIGTTIQGAGITGSVTVTALGGGTGTAGNGGTGAYTVSGGALNITAEPMFASGDLPAAASSLMINGSVTGTLGGGMLVSDGGVNITGSPIAIASSQSAVNGNAVWGINQTYYPANIAYTGLVATHTTLVPGQYVQAAASPNSGGVLGSILTPVSIVGFGAGFDPSQGGVGPYLLSNAASNGVGSSGSPVAFISTGIGDSGAIAPGPALTIKNLGEGVTFPVTNFSAGTGSLALSGTFDTSVLGGKPTFVQAQVSYTPNGPAVPGCAACAWTNLSGYSATLDSGTVWNWSGQALNIPGASGPLFVSVRASNDSRIGAGTFYATMPSYIKVGLIFDWWGEGQMGALVASQSGTANSTFVGLFGLNEWTGPSGLLQGPPIDASGYVAGQPYPLAGDRFSVLSLGIPVAEGVSDYAQLLTNAFGWPVTVIDNVRDGIGASPQTMGNVTQTQSIGVGDGSTTTFCSGSTASVSKFCTSPGISTAGPLFFNAASMTGANITASIAGNTLTMTSLNLGALEPGLILSDSTGSITGAPTLVNCLTGCIPTGVPLDYPNAQTWTISGASQTVASEAMRLDPVGGAPFSAYNTQAISLSFVNGGFGTELIQAGTFKITVNGTVVCQDTNVFAYNLQGGNCTGAGVSSSFVNYATGDYQVTFSTAPTGPILASWTNIISPDGNQAPLTSRPQGFDFFGNGLQGSGPISNAFLRAPAGVTGHVFGGGASDDVVFNRQGYAVGAAAYTQVISWLYATKFPNVIPGQSAATPFISANPFRAQGPITYNTTAAGANALDAALLGQWTVDVTVKSTFSGTIASNVLTLSAPASGPMWEGEVIACATVSGSCPLNASSGVFILSLASGTWGASGSTYNLAGSPANISTPSAMQNAVYYLGSGGAFYAGPMHDTPVQSGGSLAGTNAQAAHLANGPFAGRRVAARMAALTWGGLTNPANASDPTVDRVKADAGANACDTASLATPCFDVGTGGSGGPYAAHHSATIQGATITVTGGIAAHDRPFVVGQALFCSGCATGLFITSIDVPPSQSTTTGAGEVGQTFHITANASLLAGPTTETVTAGCSGTSGVGSNCIDIAFKKNTTNGSYGTAWSLATCGENNLNGIGVPNYNYPNGICQTNGIGSLVRDFRVGTNQAMFGLPTSYNTGSPYDDGADADGGSFNQSGAFTANIVAPGVVQLVKGAAYDPVSHLLTSIGQWLSPAATTSITSGTYNSTTGALSITFSQQVNPASVGSTLTISGLGGTGVFGSLNGTWPISSFPNAATATGVSTVNLTATTGLGAATISGGSAAIGNGTFVEYGDSILGLGRIATLSGYVGGQPFPLTAGSGGTPGTSVVTPTSCTTATGFVLPKMDVTINSSGALVNAYPSSTTSSQTMGISIGAGCQFAPTSGSGTIAPPPQGMFDGAGGIATYSTDSNMMGDLLYDNSGLPGNPLNSFFTNGFGGYWEPGLPVPPFGEFMGLQVNG